MLNKALELANDLRIELSSASVKASIDLAPHSVESLGSEILLERQVKYSKLKELVKDMQRIYGQIESMNV